MKLLIIYQFYLDYVLPRDSEWENKQFGFELKDSFISVRPKNANEDLFPDSIDETLSTMSLSLQKLNFGNVTLKRVVKDIVIDRVEVRLERICTNIDELKNEDFQEERFAEAIKCCNIFLNHCRVLSKNPFLKLLPREYNIKQKKYYNLFPLTVIYLNKDDPDEKPDVFNGVNAEARSGAIRSPESGVVHIHEILKTLEPDFYNSLVVDSLEMISAGRLKEAILLLAICCETKVMKAFTDKGITKSQLKKFKQENRSFAEHYFDFLTRQFIKRSLKDEDKQTFDLLEKLYRVRSNIAHEGKCVYYLDDGSESKVDEILCIDFSNATEKVLIWIDSAFK